MDPRGLYKGSSEPRWERVHSRLRCAHRVAIYAAAIILQSLAQWEQHMNLQPLDATTQLEPWLTRATRGYSGLFGATWGYLGV